MARYSNNFDIPIGLAVWLLNDTYDYISEENYISATSLMRPIRQIILGSRLNQENQTNDVADLISSGIGRAVHDSVEKAWLTNHRRAMSLLGLPEDAQKRVLVNPTPEELTQVKNPVPIYLEQRSFKQVGNWKVGGKFDLVVEGVVQDIKTTSVYSWIYGSKDADYITQLSLYRWLNPKIVTEDYGIINFVFTDWQKHQAKVSSDYPKQRIVSKSFTLMTAAETERWVRSRLSLLDQFWNKPESELPECTDDELWRSETVFKYYKDPTKTNGRSTKNFSSLMDAQTHQIAAGGVGTILTVPGEPKRCEYCSAYSLCSQKDKYFP